MKCPKCDSSLIIPESFPTHENPRPLLECQVCGYRDRKDRFLVDKEPWNPTRREE